MGLCASTEDGLSADEHNKQRAELAKTKVLDGMLNTTSMQERGITKLLLLGAGESGKSTIFKQITSLYGSGYTDEQRSQFVAIICNNIITAMQSLCSHVDQYGPLETQEARIAMMRLTEDRAGDESIDKALATDIELLWKDPGMQKCYAARAKFQVFDSAEYFFTKIQDIAAPDYLPTFDDIMCSRIRTTGIVEMTFEIDGNVFRMFDVGGQRNERKKWIHCFEGVTAVLFVAALSEYDQLLYEDETTNRMVEALNLFEDICNSRWFKDTAMMLFLNKSDLFMEKVKTVSLRECFEDYDGADTFEDGCEFLRQQFEAKNANPEKTVYSHVTCARDQHSVSVVFDAVKDIIIRRSLTEAGLV